MKVTLRQESAIAGSVRRMPPTWVGLAVAFVAALITNTAYSLEHDAAATLPPLSPRRPFRSARLLLRNRRWLGAFAAESVGWLMYVAALRLAPLALVQAVTASGVAVLAFATARGHPARLAWRERFAVVLALAGLTLLALSLVGVQTSDRRPAIVGVVIWLAACGGGAVLIIATPTRFARAASLGLATGLLFADGDISAKLVGYGGLWVAALLPLIAPHPAGASVLQSAYQHGDALTTARMATVVTNAVPIVAGVGVFHAKPPPPPLPIQCHSTSSPPPPRFSNTPSIYSGSTTECSQSRHPIFSNCASKTGTYLQTLPELRFS